jgi:hypothetical protein
MKVRMVNGPRGVARTVPWKANKAATLIQAHPVRSVDFCLGEDVEAEDGTTSFQPLGSVQRLNFEADVSAVQIATQVTARAKELETALEPAAIPTPIDIDLA